MGMIGNTLAQGLISGANIVDGTVDTPDIKDSAVTAAKIATGVVTPAKMDFSAGTANGVPYLNGSKVLTTGSALTFDGSTFGLGVTAAGMYVNSTGQGTSSVWLAGTSGSASLTQFGGELRFNIGGTANTAATGATEKMRLDASGSLLVGTTSAAYSASGRGVIGVNGTSAAQLYLSKAGSSSTAAYLYYDGTDIVLANDTSGGAIKFWSQGGTERARIDSSGNWIVGATSVRSSAKLDVFGNLIALGSNPTYYGTIDYSAGTGLLTLNAESTGGISFKTGGTERARIDYNNNFYVNGYHVMRFRGGMNWSDVNNFTGSAYDGYWQIAFSGHSGWLFSQNSGGSAGTIQMYSTYFDGPWYRSKTDNSSWTSWRQL